MLIIIIIIQLQGTSHCTPLTTDILMSSDQKGVNLHGMNKNDVITQLKEYDVSNTVCIYYIYTQ